MKPVTTAIAFFSRRDLACKGSGVVKLDPRFASALVEFRALIGRPVRPSSVCRTPAHNRKVNGHKFSLHLTENPRWPTLGSMAIDWPWAGWSLASQLKFAQLAWERGWSVGLHTSFCHLDRRADLQLKELPQNVFVYGTWDNRFKIESVKGGAK